MSARELVKEAIELALIASGVATLARRRLAGRVLILAYHNVVRDEDAPAGDLGNHLPLSKFTAQITALRATHDVVSLETALSDAPSRKPRVAITFDDAYAGAIAHAIPELVRLGMPATVFVAPAFVGGKSFWWDALAMPNGKGLDPHFRALALNDLRGEDAPIREAARVSGRLSSDVPPALRCALETELLAAAAQPGITLGSHTWGHPNLTKLRPEELQRELTKPLDWLRQRVARPLAWIAYPYGFFNAAVERAAIDAGYVGALAVSGGWMASPPSNKFALPRLNVPRGLTQRGFIIRTAGILAR